MKYQLVAITFAFMVTATGTLSYAAPAAMPTPEATSVPVETPDAVTHHSLAIGGKVFAYTARAGTITLRDDDEAPTARIFYVAYTLDGAASNRPVTFFYNGGPGSSSMWLHMGSFAPVRVETANGELTGPPPYHVVDNPQGLLDKTDLVFIDMPGSGFGRLIGKPKDFYGLDNDVKAFSQFIQRYISTFGRWNSPKFLYGESYGTTRSAALVDALQNDGVGMNGVVLQSAILNYGIDNAEVGGQDWGYILYLPTDAATAWYHKTMIDPPASVAALLPDVEHFALGEYADCLAKGANCKGSEYDDVVAKLHRYLGISNAYIEHSSLRINYSRLESEMLRNDGIAIGRLDSRFQTPTVDRLEDTPDWDPTDAAIDSAYISSVNDYLRDTLKYDTTLPYRSSVYDLIEKSGGWDFKHRGNPTADVQPDLAEAMSFNPNLRIFWANGYYDWATPYFETEYSLNHLGIAPALQANITRGLYPSGHMIYLNPQALQQLHDDLERWYDATLGGR